MMSAPLRQSAFWEILDDFPQSLSEAPPARTSAAPTPKVKASKVNARASSSRQSASSENAALVGLLLRTALISELGARTPCSLHWKHSATPAGRSWFVLATSGPITNDPGHGSSDATLSKLPTPMVIDGRQDGAGGGSGATKAATPGATGVGLNTALEMGRRETLPTPTKRDKRMDAWSPAYDKRKSPTMDAVMDGALTNRASDKWQYARQIATVLSNAGLSGASMTLPVVYGWMMGFPPGWLERALLSAVQEGQVPQVSSSKHTGTQSSRRSRKPSDSRSSASSKP